MIPPNLCFHERCIRVARLFVLLASLGVITAMACSRGSDEGGGGGQEEGGDDSIERIEVLIEAGDAEAALALLREMEIEPGSDSDLLMVEALIGSGAYDEASERLEAFEDEALVLAYEADICGMRALDAIDAEEWQAALDAVDACPTSRRIDLLVFEAYAEEPGGQFDISDAERLIDRLHESEGGPEVDVAAQWLERGLTQMFLAETDQYLRFHLLRNAYLVGQDPDLGEQLVDQLALTATHYRDSQPNITASLYDIVNNDRIPNIEWPEELVATAATDMNAATYDVYQVQIRIRYEQKHAEDDVELGLTEDNQTFTFPPVDDYAERRQAVAEWIYRIAERPMPTPHPDYPTQSELCADIAQPCVVQWPIVTRWLFDIDEIEDALAAEIGAPLEYHE